MVLSLRLDLFLVTKSLELENALSDASATEVGLIFCKIMYNIPIQIFAPFIYTFKTFISFFNNFLVVVAVSYDIWFNFACNFNFWILNRQFHQLTT